MKALIFALALVSNSALSQARYCDAVVATSAHDWGIEMTVTSTSTTGIDCFFIISVLPTHEAQTTELNWMLSRVEPSPSRFSTDGGCQYKGVKLNCGIALKAGGRATILGVRRIVDVKAPPNCYSASAQNFTFFSGFVGLESRPSVLVCLPE